VASDGQSNPSPTPAPAAAGKRLAAWLLGWVFAAALYLLLIDITDLPELIVGAGAAMLAATGFELAREQHVAGQLIRPTWLARAYRPILKVGSDVVLVSAAAVMQLLERKPSRGEFRVVRFRAGAEDPLDTGRRALAQALGSFAPNTIIIGVDPERQLVLGHQLHGTGGREAIDPLELG